MKRLLVTVIASVSLAAAPAAAGGKPVKIDLGPPSDPFVTNVCGFPVLVAAEGAGINLEFWDDEGNLVRVIGVFPGLRWVLTNLDTEETIRVPLNGPIFVDLAADGSGTVSGSGPWGAFEHPDTGVPGLFLRTGRFTATFDAEGNDLSFSFVGHVVDLCERLSP